MRYAASLLVVMLLAAASPAYADATFFLGTNTTPETRLARGFAVGAGAMFAFEVEYANTSEDGEEAAPGLRTFMGNFLLQTPFAIGGVQPYFTAGTGVYRESLEPRQETNLGLNTGVGVKVSLAGPVRVRVDYRVFHLKGDPLYNTVHRVYAGLNLRF